MQIVSFHIYDLFSFSYIFTCANSPDDCTLNCDSRNRLEYIFKLPLNLFFPAILFYFTHALFPFLSFLFSFIFYHSSTIKLLTTTNYIIHPQITLYGPCVLKNAIYIHCLLNLNMLLKLYHSLVINCCWYSISMILLQLLLIIELL